MTDSTTHNNPMQLAPGIFWVGHKTDQEFECNAYLRVFEGNGTKFNLLIDPGPRRDFTSIAAKVEKVIGKEGKVNLAFLNHQDPDVCFNAVFFQKRYPDMQVIASSDTWRFANAYELAPDKFISTESFKGGRIRLKTGHYIRTIPTPHTHAAGACALYDEEQQFLFSGDLFAGMDAGTSIYADEANWEGIATFHRLYMPTNRALRQAVSIVRNQAGDARFIAPQHGGIIKKENIDYFLEKVEELEVGIDLGIDPDLLKHNYILALNQILDRIRDDIDPELHSSLINDVVSGKESNSFFTTKDEVVVDLPAGGAEAFRFFAGKLCSLVAPEKKVQLKDIVLATLAQWDITTDVPPCPDSEDTTEQESGAPGQQDIDQLLDELLQDG
jgi:glyoxylase-like metal-dependent hydrolase (beta-lactamase superfamily II)